MKKTTYLALVCLIFTATQVIGQSFTSKMLKTKVVSYPKNPFPENFKNYRILASSKTNSAPLLSNTEVASTIDFQSFNYSEDSSDFILAYRTSEPYITKTLTPRVNKNKEKEYRFTVKTMMSISVNILDATATKLFYTNQYKLDNLYLDPATGQPSNLRQQKPEELHYEIDRTVSQEEVGEYFILSDDEKSFRLTESYQKQILAVQLSRLMLKASQDLQKQFDLRVNKYLQRYYVLNKIDEEPKSDELYLSLQNTYENIESIDDLNQADFKNQMAFNQSIIDKYGSDDKAEKVVWASYFNQAFLLKASKKYDEAKDYANKAIDFKIRKQVSKLLFTDILTAKDGYNRVFNDDGSKKPIAPNYIGLAPDAPASSLESGDTNNAAPEGFKEVKIDKLAGYVLNDKGDKEYEGTIYIEFIGNKTKKVLNMDTGQTTEVPSTDYGKDVLIAYEKKGKTKAKKIKAKELYSFYINDTQETYEGFATEKDALEKLMGMATLGGGNHKYYLVKHDAGKVKIYEDLTVDFDGFVLKLNKEEKGIKISKTLSSSKFLSEMADFYGKCKDLEAKIEKGEFSNTMEDHIKMADIYSGCVKK
ncbi:hypothetical protein [Tamlana sp. I1]|uniref:hypothetical protein n=1 Tax=Tamlana sp. I1 TaxID=2762061 RepID=UPI00188DE150|nr:hypothetical protein [Tamlana sp. I1]